MPPETIVFSIAAATRAQVAANRARLHRIADELNALTGVKVGMDDALTIKLDPPWSVNGASTYDRAKLIVDGERGVGIQVWSSGTGGYRKLYASDLRCEASDLLASRSPQPLEDAVLACREQQRVIEATNEPVDVAATTTHLEANIAQLHRIADELDALRGVRAGMGDVPTIQLEEAWEFDAPYDWAKLIVDDDRGVGVQVWSSSDLNLLRLYADDFRGDQSVRFADRSPQALEQAVVLLARGELEAACGRVRPAPPAAGAVANSNVARAQAKPTQQRPEPRPPRLPEPARYTPEQSRRALELLTNALTGGERGTLVGAFHDALVTAVPACPRPPLRRHDLRGAEGSRPPLDAGGSTGNGKAPDAVTTPTMATARSKNAARTPELLADLQHSLWFERMVKQRAVVSDQPRERQAPPPKEDAPECQALLRAALSITHRIKRDLPSSVLNVLARRCLGCIEEANLAGKQADAESLYKEIIDSVWITPGGPVSSFDKKIDEIPLLLPDGSGRLFASCQPHVSARALGNVEAFLREDGMVVIGAPGSTSDLAKARDLGVDVIISLLNPPTQGYEDACRALGIQLISQPVDDFWIPDLADTIRSVHAMFDALLSGRNLLVHCENGLGRTGTVIACFLTSLGADAASAISYVRDHRRGAIETREQESFVHDFASAMNFAVALQSLPT